MRTRAFVLKRTETQDGGGDVAFYLTQSGQSHHELFEAEVFFSMKECFDRARLAPEEPWYPQLVSIAINEVSR